MSDNTITGNPRTPIRPGRTLYWFAAFGIDTGKPAISVAPTVPDATGAYDALQLGTATRSD